MLIFNIFIFCIVLNSYICNIIVIIYLLFAHLYINFFLLLLKYYFFIYLSRKYYKLLFFKVIHIFYLPIVYSIYNIYRFIKYVYKINILKRYNFIFVCLPNKNVEIMQILLRYYNNLNTIIFKFLFIIFLLST